MLINSIHFIFDAQDVPEVESSGVIQYHVGRSPESPGALNAHLASEHFQRIYLNGIKSLVQRRDVVRLCYAAELGYEVTAVKDATAALSITTTEDLLQQLSALV